MPSLYARVSVNVWVFVLYRGTSPSQTECCYSNTDQHVSVSNSLAHFTHLLSTLADHSVLNISESRTVDCFPVLLA